jgi:hypothetical protein
VEAAELDVPGQLVGPGQEVGRPAPVLRGDGGVGEGRLAQQGDAAAPERPLRRVGRGQLEVDLRAQVAAGLGPEPARMHAHLLAQAGDAKARQLAGDTDRVERAQQLECPVLGALGAGDSRHRPVAEQHGFGEGAALQHVEAVREQVAGTRVVALPGRRGEQRRDHAGERAAPAESSSARASVGCSSFSASSAWPSQRYDSPTMKSPQRPR